ncbi:MAG: type II toxin-antitoxin system RelE/ParE family toxin [Oscillospiraceae bacterium]|nr:type II toxin-antitoxin system RelE/ParE family toxin [Oscillospiraceae bacterium]
MERYNVIISPAAQNDFIDVIEHLDTLSPDAALQYFDLFIEKASMLAKAPENCPLSRDTQLRLRGYRLLPIENYIVFYVINGNTVELRRVLYARRQYERLF